MPDTFIKIDQVCQLVAMSKTEVYRRVRQNRFPRQCRLSHKVSVWSQNEVSEWMLAQRQSA